MDLNRISHYMSGYVDIVVEGYYIERFINICTNKQIILWNLKRQDSITLYASIEVKRFKELKDICRKTKCKVKIKDKKGIFFTLRKYKKRKFFIGFLIIILVIIFTLSNFVWNIEIEGLTNIQAEEILNLVKNEGLDIGKFKNSIDEKAIINKIRLERDDVAWARN